MAGRLIYRVATISGGPTHGWDGQRQRTLCGKHGWRYTFTLRIWASGRSNACGRCAAIKRARHG